VDLFTFNKTTNLNLLTDSATAAAAVTLHCPSPGSVYVPTLNYATAGPGSYTGRCESNRANPSGSILSSLPSTENVPSLSPYVVNGLYRSPAHTWRSHFGTSGILHTDGSGSSSLYGLAEQAVVSPDSLEHGDAVLVPPVPGTDATVVDSPRGQP
jgi:hypothetical protein